MASAADIVEFKNGDGYWHCNVPKTQKPAKARALREAGKRKDGTTVYEVPKSDLYAYSRKELADGSVIAVMRIKAIPFEQRMAFYEKAKAAGLDVREPVAPKRDGKDVGITMESLGEVSPKAETDETM